MSGNSPSTASIDTEIINFIDHKILGPKLENLVKQLCLIEPTSVNNERTFSIANRVKSLTRMQLATEKINIIVFLNQNLK